MRKNYLGKETPLGLRLISDNPFFTKSEGFKDAVCLDVGEVFQSPKLIKNVA